MSKLIASILTGESLTLYFKGRPYTYHKSNPLFDSILKAANAQDEVALEKLVEVKKTVISQTNGALRLVDGSIFYGDTEVHGAVVGRVMELLKAGLDANPMLRFIENLMQNPSKRAVDELWSFIEACNLPVTSDGHFLAYKRVRENYHDVHSGKFDNSVGKVLTMPRNQVDEDKNRTCSAGLHFCSYDYLAHFGGERIVVVKINPADVVAIPADYNNSKGRTCRYEVVDEIPVNEYRMPEKPITPFYDSRYEDGGDRDDWVPEDEDDGDEWEVDSDVEDTSDLDYRYEDEDGDYVLRHVVDEIVSRWNNGYSLESLYDDYLFIPEEVIDQIVEDNDSRPSHISSPAPLVTGNAAPAPTTVSAKLTEVDVRGIRNMLRDGLTLKAISQAYNISERQVARIRDGQAWNNVK